MDSFSLLKTIERIRELRFKYIGSYPSDKIPQLTNSAPSNDRVEHWIMVAQLDKTYYFADSLGQKRSIFSSLTKKYRRMVLRKPKATKN